MDKILPGIIAGIIVLAAGFLLFYFFIEYYAKKRLKRDRSIDEKLKKLDEVLPLIDNIMKKGFDPDDILIPEYVGSENDECLAREIETISVGKLEHKPAAASDPNPETPVEKSVSDNNPKKGIPIDVLHSLYEKL